MNFDNTPAEPVGLLAAAWAPVRVAVTPWDTLPGSVANGSVVDGVTLATGDRFVVVGERDDAGIYVVGASTSARATDADTAGEFVAPRRVRVLEGGADNVGAWVFRTAGPIVLGTTPLVFSFLGAYDEELQDQEFNKTPPGSVSLPGYDYDVSPAVPISTATSTLVYYGQSELETLTEGQLKSALLSTTKLAVAGNYICGETGYKYLAVPASMTAPVTIRDLLTGLTVPLASEFDGYSQVANSLNYASLTIDGVTYRVYRSANQLAAAVTLQVA